MGRTTNGLLAIVMMLTLISGCAARRALTRAQYMTMVSRTYEGVKPKEAIAAAEKLLRLADEEDITFQHSEQGFRAHRAWLLYFVLAAATGTDIWTVTAAPVEGGAKVTMYLHRVGGGIIPSGVFPADTMAIYDLFWGRMDYLLGRRDRWMTCEEAQSRVNQGITFGSLEYLCLFTDDKKPEGK